MTYGTVAASLTRHFNRRRTLRLTEMGAAALVMLLAAAPGHAQAVAGPAVSLNGGARTYEGGAAVAVALRAEYPLSPFFLIEGAGSVADPVEGVPRSATSVFELQAQAQLPGGRVVPYLGVGGGFARFRQILDGPHEEEGILSAAVGARIGLQRQLTLVADARARATAAGLDDGHLDLTLGLRYRFR